MPVNLEHKVALGAGWYNSRQIHIKDRKPALQNIEWYLMVFVSIGTYAFCGRGILCCWAAAWRMHHRLWSPWLLVSPRHSSATKFVWEACDAVSQHTRSASAGHKAFRIFRRSACVKRITPADTFTAFTFASDSSRSKRLALLYNALLLRRVSQVGLAGFKFGGGKRNLQYLQFQEMTSMGCTVYTTFLIFSILFFSVLSLILF